jgi:hypothetical protein
MIDVIEKEKDLAIQLILLWGIIVLLTMIFFEVSDMAAITYLPVDDVNLETVNPSLIIPEFVVE